MIWPPKGFAGIRVVGDVHGDAEAFRAAIEGARAANLFVLQLGDLTDDGPDSPEALRLMFRLLDEGRGLFLLGNHEHKLRRALRGERVAIEPESLGRCLDQLAIAPDREALAARAIAEIERTPAGGSGGARPVRRADRPDAAERQAGADLSLDRPHPGRHLRVCRP
jgi:protein phosphatase